MHYGIFCLEITVKLWTRWSIWCAEVFSTALMEEIRDWSHDKRSCITNSDEEKLLNRARDMRTVKAEFVVFLSI